MTGLVPTLQTDDVSVSRGGRSLLRNVSVTALPGEVVGLLGPSGAGKSTFFRAVVGEAPPDSGRILIDGIDMTRWPLWKRARAGVGYVPQGASVLWDLTVRENLDVFAALTHTPKNAEEAALRVGLEGRLNVRSGQLSAGERRRLEVARALARKPRLLVCDEPFAGVDPAGAARLGNLLTDLACQGVAVLLADHHVEEALRVCSRAVLLLDGAVAVDAPPSGFREHPLVEGRYLGTWHRTLPPPAP